MNNRRDRDAVVAVLIWIGLVGPCVAVGPSAVDGVARVNGASISHAQMQAAIELQRVGSGLRETADAADERHLQEAALEQLISFEVLWQEAHARGAVVDEAEVDRAFAARQARFENEAAFLAQLDAMGFAAEAYRDNLRRSLSVKRLLAAERDAVTVSKADVRAFYEQEQEKMRRPAQIRVRHILIRPPEDASDPAKRGQMEALLARARAGEDFARLAALYSEGPSRMRGGDLGYFGAGKMVPAFERAAFALEAPGDISDVVETRFGYHIIRLEGRRGGGIAPLEEVETQIYDHLYQARRRDRIVELTDRLRDRADIEVLVSR